MMTFYLTKDNDNEILYETSSPKQLKSVVVDLLVEGAEKVHVHNRNTGKIMTYPEKAKNKSRSHVPYVTLNKDGVPCFRWEEDNPERQDWAEYDIRNKRLTIAGKTVDGHPEFRNLKSFRDYVNRYLVDGCDGYNPHEILRKITDLYGMADYINRNPKTWAHEVFPYIEKMGCSYMDSGRKIIAKQDNKLLMVGTKGQALVLTDNNRLELIDKLQMRIKQSGLPMTVIAERSGIQVANIYKILNGKYNPTIDLLDKLVGVLGLKIDLVDK